MRGSHKDTSTVGCLHHVTQERRHIQIFRHVEDVTEICECSCLHGQRKLRLRNLFQHKFEDVFHILQGERVAQDLAEKDLRHVAQDDLVLAHERLEEHLIDLIVGTP